MKKTSGRAVAAVAAEADVRAWRAEGLLDGMIRRAREGDALACEWDDRAIGEIAPAADVDGVRAAYPAVLRALLLSKGAGR